MKSPDFELCVILISKNQSRSSGTRPDRRTLVQIDSKLDRCLVHEIAYERRRIKEEMEKLGVKQNQILDMIEVLHMSKMTTLAIKGIVCIRAN